MDKQQANKQHNPSLLSKNTTKEDPSSTKTTGVGWTNGGGGGGGGDRLKRDEWSEGAVSSLIEAYEAKWILRNRAKLKGQDWEDVAKHVSSRSNSTKSPKTQTQCKNKIESMKKRYRSESATADASSWPLFPRIDLLLRGSAPPPHALPPPPPPPPPPSNPPLMLLEQSLLLQTPPAPPPPPPPPPPPALLPPPLPHSHGSNGVDRGNKEDAMDPPPTDTTDSSTPAAAAFYEDDEKEKSRNLKARSSSVGKKKMKMRRRIRKGEWEAGESIIRQLAEAVVRSEQARMETMREIERMRVQADAKRGELELQRTQIIANTQLEIARLFAKGNVVDSSLRIGRN